MSTTSHEQQRAALALVAAVAETIRELQHVPSGTLYASLMNKMTIQDYTATIDMLKRAKLVAESAHELRWIGPVICMNNAYRPGTRVVRLHEYRAAQRAAAHRDDCFTAVVGGTIRYMTRDCFGKRCSMVAWDDGSESLMDHRDLKRVSTR